MSSDGCRGAGVGRRERPGVDRRRLRRPALHRCTRLARGKLTVVDATNVQPEARKPLVALAREYHVLPVAIVIDLPERVCHERNRVAAGPRLRPACDSEPAEPAASFAARAWSAKASATSTCSSRRKKSMRPTIEREPLWNNRKREHGPVRHHRRRPRLLRRARTAARSSSATSGTTAEPSVTPRRPQGDLRRRPGGPWAAYRRHAQDGDGDGRRPARRSACPATTTSS